MAGDAEELESQLAASAVAPRISLEELRARIARVEYIVPEGTVLTICLLHLDNGFIVTGESAPVSPENFSAQVGADIAYQRAEGELWKLLGFLLRERLYRERS